MAQHDEKCNNDNFVGISNQEIYNKICSMEETFNITINGNGKKGLKERISNNTLNLKILWTINLALLIAILKNVIVK